jgi:hypothetical protein
MPIKSKAQRRKFAQLLVEGKITPETYEEWNRTAGKARMPERVAKKKKAKKRATRNPRTTKKRAKRGVGKKRAKPKNSVRRSNRS